LKPRRRLGLHYEFLFTRWARNHRGGQTISGDYFQSFCPMT
jgi:hypothetical protein